MNYYAHTKNDKDGNPLPQSEWEPLFSSDCASLRGLPCDLCESLAPDHGHLNKVAYWTGKFAAEMFPPDSTESQSARQWGFLIGLWHDLGKFSEDFQSYLSRASDPHHDEVIEKVDHTTAGAKHAVSLSTLGHFVATAIAGHHAGLLDARHESHACLEKRLNKSFGSDIPAISAPPEIIDRAFPAPPPFLPDPRTVPFASAFFQRILFACLVDADFLATEAFMNPAQSAFRPSQTSDIFPKSLQLLDAKISSFGPPDPEDKVAAARASVVQDCARSAPSRSGIFTLTVPTGGGKTLSSLNFALRHAIAHGKRRIIYVVPFTSIIILDEAQCLPVHYLTPCLRVLEELSTRYHTTTVPCTATQPAVAKSSDFPLVYRSMAGLDSIAISSSVPRPTTRRTSASISSTNPPLSSAGS